MEEIANSEPNDNDVDNVDVFGPSNNNTNTSLTASQVEKVQNAIDADEEITASQATRIAAAVYDSLIKYKGPACAGYRVPWGRSNVIFKKKRKKKEID